MAKVFDLEKRSTEFAKAVIVVCKNVPRNPTNDRIVGQVVGSSGSVGANYREANDPLGKKDFLQRMRIARREAKESHHWLELLLTANSNNELRIKPLIQEADELKRILLSIINRIFF